MELYSKNQVQRGQAAMAKGRFNASETAAKMPRSASVVRRGPRSETSSSTPRARMGKIFVHTASERTAAAQRSRPRAQSQRPAASGRMPKRSQFRAPYTRSAGDAAQTHGAVPGRAQANQSVPSAQSASSAKVSAKYPARPGASRLGNHISRPSRTGYSILSSRYGTAWRRAPRSSCKARMSE